MTPGIREVDSELRDEYRPHSIVESYEPELGLRVEYVQTRFSRATNEDLTGQMAVVP